MITTASSFVSEGLSLITVPLMTFVETHFERELGQDWQKKVRREFKKSPPPIENGHIHWDNSDLFKAMNMDTFWLEVFNKDGLLNEADRSYINKLIGVRHQHAHPRVSNNGDTAPLAPTEAFTDEEAKHALDTMQLLMQSIGADDVAAKIKDMYARIGNRLDEEKKPDEKLCGRRIYPPDPLLVGVEADKLIRGKPYTVLHFYGGRTKQIRTDLFDKDGSLTAKLKRLVGKRVKTEYENDRKVGYNAMFGYFSKLDEA